MFFVKLIWVIVIVDRNCIKVVVSVKEERMLMMGSMVVRVSWCFVGNRGGRMVSKVR